MKNFEQHSFQKLEPSLEPLEVNTNDSPNLFDRITINCKGGKTASEYCSEEDCIKEAVICRDQQCKCQVEHVDCNNFVKINKFHKVISNKVIDDTSDILGQIDSEVKKITDRVSQMYTEFEEMFKSFGLNKSDETIRQKITVHFENEGEKKADKKLTGNDFYRHRESLKQSNKNWFEYSYEKYKKVLKKAQAEILPMFQNISSVLTYLHTVCKANHQLENYFMESSILLNFMKGKINSSNPQGNMFNNNQIFGASSIQNKSESSMEYLLGKLQEKMKIYSCKRIFSYDLKKSEFFRRDNLIDAIEERQNLLMLVKTKSQTIYAAFVQTKLVKDKQRDSSNSNNQSKKSAMIFNLTGEKCFDNSAKEKSGFVLTNFDTLQIGQIKTDNTELKSINLSIHFDQELMQVSAQIKNHMNHQHQARIKGHKVDDSNLRNNITIANLEVYQVFVDKFLEPLPIQVKEEKTQKTLRKQRQVRANNVGNGGLFGGTTELILSGQPLFDPQTGKFQGLFGQKSPQMNGGLSPFGSTEPQQTQLTQNPFFGNGLFGSNNNRN